MRHIKFHFCNTGTHGFVYVRMWACVFDFVLLLLEVKPEARGKEGEKGRKEYNRKPK